MVWASKFYKELPRWCYRAAGVENHCAKGSRHPALPSPPDAPTHGQRRASARLSPPPPIHTRPRTRSLEQKRAARGDSEAKISDSPSASSALFCFPISPPLLVSGGRKWMVESEPPGFGSSSISHLLGDLEHSPHTPSSRLCQRKKTKLS